MAHGKRPVDLNDPAPFVRSSLRYKEEVRDMGARTDRLFDLRPVTFRYKAQKDSHAHFGLIAEEVADVIPELVVRNRDGQIETVAYHELAPMLLNELQKMRIRLMALEGELAAMLATTPGAPHP